MRAKQNELNSIVTGGAGGKVIYDGGPFLWPTTFTKISSGFGYRWGTNHNGVDISNGTYGAPIYAIADGVVYIVRTGCTHNYPKQNSCGCGGGYGNYVAIDHGRGSDGNSYKAYYAHMTSVAVSNGAHVKRGQVIGYVGCTGHSTGPHLHFGILLNNSWVNPMRFYTRVN